MRSGTRGNTVPGPDDDDINDDDDKARDDVGCWGGDSGTKTNDSSEPARTMGGDRRRRGGGDTVTVVGDPLWPEQSKSSSVSKSNDDEALKLWRDSGVVATRAGTASAERTAVASSGPVTEMERPDSVRPEEARCGSCCCICCDCCCCCSGCC